MSEAIYYPNGEPNNLTPVWPDPINLNTPLIRIPLNTQAKFKSDGASTDYYKFPPGFTDIIDLIEYKNMNFAIGNIFKACYRLGQKEGNDDAYDLRKIIFFAERELKRIESKT